MLNGKNDFMPNFDLDGNPPKEFPYEFNFQNIDEGEMDGILKNLFSLKNFISNDVVSKEKI